MVRLGISPRGVGEPAQSLNTLKKMLHGEPFRTVRTCQLLLDGEPCELTRAQVRSNAEHVIGHVNFNLKYTTHSYYVKMRANARRTISLPLPDATVQTVLDTKEGMIDSYGELPKDMGQVSRFGIVWWANDTGHKYIRFFGDRIHLNYKHPAVPRLYSFGQHPYHLMFQCDDPYHCLKCRKDLKMGQGVWRNNSFLCDDCVYEQDTGLRQGIGKLRKKKRR